MPAPVLRPTPRDADSGSPSDAGAVRDAGLVHRRVPRAEWRPRLGLRKTMTAYGANWAWSVFAGDFGGIASWNEEGVAASATA